MIRTVAQIETVERKQTGAGKSFGVVIDTEGRRYTSWADPLTIQAESLQGQTVQLGYDESTSKDGRFTNLTLRIIQPTGNGGSELSNGGTSTSPISEQRDVDDQTGRTVGAAGEDWLDMVRNAARRGEWRAAEALQRREDIARSVAIKAALDFFEYLQQEDRTPANLELMFTQVLSILNGS